MRCLRNSRTAALVRIASAVVVLTATSKTTAGEDLELADDGATSSLDEILKIRSSTELRTRVDNVVRAIGLAGVKTSVSELGRDALEAYVETLEAEYSKELGIIHDLQ